MWIFCGGMPRAGSTLQFQLTAHLVEGAGLGERVDWVRHDQFPLLRERHATETRWKVFKTHRCTPEIIDEFSAGNAKGVYVFRDVRDALVSRMLTFGKSFESVWTQRNLESMLMNHERWTSLDGVLVSKYEEMVADVPAEVERIAAHLGTAVTHEEAETIAAEYTPERQRERLRSAAEEGRIERSTKSPFDPVSNLHLDHLHSGRSGEWRKVLSREQLALIEGRARDWLVANDYRLSMPALQRMALTSLHPLRRRRRRVGGRRSA